MACSDPDVLHVSGLVAAIFVSPTWTSPIANFVDENCSIFENQEENKLEYTLVHNAFKNLVDTLLEAHLAELDVTRDQFERFLKSGLNGDSLFHRELVEQLLSVEDFLFFKAMMVKRNVQLNRQAMESCALPTPSYQSSVEGLQPNTQEIEAQVTEDAKRELERRCVEAELQLAMALSMQLQKRLQLMEALSEILEAISEMREVPADAAIAAEASANAALTVQVGAVGMPMSLDEEHAAAMQRERAARAMEASRQQAELSRNVSVPSEDDRRVRAEHLRRQRDEIVAQKKQERNQQLTCHQQTTGPSQAGFTAETAIARQEADRGKKLAAELSGQVVEVSPLSPTAADLENSKALEMRRALARQLRETFT